MEHTEARDMLAAGTAIAAATELPIINGKAGI